MNGTLFLILVAVATSAGGLPLQAQPVAGFSRVVDGDTLIVAGRPVRLHGIDAPEARQTCRTDDGRRYRCGAASTRALRRLTRGRRVRCVVRGRDRYRRLIAVCRAGGVELNREMVRLGWAVAFRRYSRDYLDEELEAAKANRGIWRGGFQRPGVWRDRHRPRDVRAARRPGCLIKGNISSRGRIYHVPSARSYSKTRINTSRGERWFCSEAEAIAAGWRAPGR